VTDLQFSGLRDRAGRAYAFVTEIHRDREMLVTTVRLSDVPSGPLVPAALWELTNDSSTEVIPFHRLRDREGDFLAFETFDPVTRLPLFEHEYVFQQWFAQWQMDIVTDTSRRWKRRVYPENGDHDHCRLTWESIDAGAEAYRSNRDWITVDAYNKYIRDDFLKVRGTHK
jgi:hypothetical protein